MYMYRRRVGGMLERALLGAAMTIVLAILERRLSRPRDRRRGRCAGEDDRGCGDGRLPAPGCGAAGDTRGPAQPGHGATGQTATKAGIHYGPCIAVTLNDRLDYFGSTVNIAARLEGLSSGKDVIISGAVRDDPDVELLLAQAGNSLRAEPMETMLKGLDGERFALWRVVH